MAAGWPVTGIQDCNLNFRVRERTCQRHGPAGRTIGAGTPGAIGADPEAALRRRASAKWPDLHRHARECPPEARQRCVSEGPSMTHRCRSGIVEVAGPLGPDWTMSTCACQPRQGGMPNAKAWHLQHATHPICKVPRCTHEHEQRVLSRTPRPFQCRRGGRTMRASSAASRLRRECSGDSRSSACGSDCPGTAPSTNGLQTHASRPGCSVVLSCLTLYCTQQLAGL